MSYKHKHIISPADIIDLYHEIKGIISDYGINILNNENLSTCTQFVVLCYQHIPHNLTDLSPIEYKRIQKHKPQIPTNPMYASESYVRYMPKSGNENNNSSDDWQLVK